MVSPWRLLATTGALGVMGNFGQLVILATAYRLWLEWHGPQVLDSWLVLVAFASCGALLDLGLSGAALQRLSALDVDAAKAWKRSCVALLSRTTIVGAVAVGVVAWLWLRSRLSDPQAVIAALAVASWSFSIAWSNFQAGVLKADLRFGAAAMLIILQQAALFLGPCWATSAAGFDITASIAAIGLLGVALLGRWLIGPVSNSVALEPSWRQLFKDGAPYAAQNGLAFFFSHFQRLVIASVAGPGEIAALAAAQSVFGKAQGLIGAASEALNPVVARGLFNPRFFWRAVFFNATACVAGFMLLGFLAHYLFVLWLPGEVGIAATRIVPILMVGYAAAASAVVAVHILNGVGKAWMNPACGAGAAVLSLVGLAIGRAFGLPPLLTAAGSVSVSYLAYTISILIVGHRILLNDKKRKPCL